MANPGARQILIQAVVWILIGFGFMRGTLDNYAHLGGFAFGIPCGLLLEGRRGRKRLPTCAAVSVRFSKPSPTATMPNRRRRPPRRPTPSVSRPERRGRA